jgi:hypothetical protein
MRGVIAVLCVVLISASAGFELVPRKISLPSSSQLPSQQSRRDILQDFLLLNTATTTATLLLHPLPVHAANKVKPAAAFEKLVQAQQELRQAQQQLAKNGDLDGLRNALSASEINNYETYSLAILGSKLLAEEDKKAIGTIRTYGAGADVMIMYGGLQAELGDENSIDDEPNYGEVKKYLARTIDSLSEVITICRNSGSF